jgi:phosphopantetheine--protein transferase-like protein
MNLGCDIVAVNRFKKWTPLWVSRYFGDDIYQQWVERNQSIDYLASRWAMKESIYKCCGIRENIVNDVSGKPISKYCAVSATHDNNMCWAIAVKL